jgi:hypothetical protein
MTKPTAHRAVAQPGVIRPVCHGCVSGGVVPNDKAHCSQSSGTPIVVSATPPGYPHIRTTSW